jgi:hypothetical protein
MSWNLKQPHTADEPPAGYEKTGRREAVKNDIAPQAPPVQTWPRQQDALNPCDPRGSNKLRIRPRKRSKPAGRGGFLTEEAHGTI